MTTLLAAISNFISPPESNVLITARTSGKNKEESIQSQLDRCKTVASEAGYANAKQYTVSTSGWKSNNLTPVLDIVNKKNIEVIVAREPDRLSRNVSFFIDFVTHLNHDVELLFTEEEFRECNAVVGRDKPFGNPYNHSLYRRIYEGQRFAEECSRKGKLGARLKRERKELNENMRDMQISEQPLEDGYYNVDEIIDRYKKGNRIVFKVRWSGYDKPTEVYRTSLIKDVPEMVKEFERSMKRQRIM
jgi:hypothetical protein